MRWAWWLPVLFVASAAAQGDDACTQAFPCPWVADLDDEGFFDGEPLQAAQGDWVNLSLMNLGDATHRVTFEGYGLEWMLEPAGAAASGPFMLDLAGTFALVDDVSGDRRTVHVTLTDPEDPNPLRDPDDVPTDPPGRDEEDSPALPWLAVVAVALSVALLRRR